jgi:hypothetical protein
MPTATDRDSLAAAKTHGVAIGLGALNCMQLTEVNNEAAVHAHELARVQLGLEFRNALRLEVVSARVTECDVVGLGLDVVDFVQRQYAKLGAFSDQHAPERLRRHQTFDGRRLTIRRSARKGRSCRS